MLGMEKNDNIQHFHSCRLGKVLSFPWDLNSLGEDALGCDLTGCIPSGIPFCPGILQEPHQGDMTNIWHSTAQPSWHLYMIRSWGWVQWGSLP